MRLRPEDAPAIALAGAGVLPIIPQSAAHIDEALERFETAVAKTDPKSLRLEQFTRYNLSPPSIMTYYGRHDRSLRENYAALVDASGVIKSLPPAGKSRSRFKLGFVVTQGHEGVFLKCMAGLIERLPERYEVWVVCSQPNGQAILSERLPHVQYLALASDLTAAAQQLQRADFDLLHYWEVGTDSTNYFLPFFRTARLQMTSWGWPVTSGIPHVDAYITCAALEPENPQPYYTEPLLYCERLPVYYLPPPVPETVDPQLLGIPADTHTYLCAQNLRKIQPEMDALFAEILARDDRAHIYLIEDKKPDITAHLHQRLQQHMSAQMERIHVLPRMPAEKYLAWVKAAHVILDTTCYTGGANTNYDAFQAGTPVVTLAGPMHRGRYTTAAYTQMGYTDCVTHSAEAYVEKAVQLATDPAARTDAVTAIKAGRHQVVEDAQAVDAFCRVIDPLLERK